MFFKAVLKIFIGLLFFISLIFAQEEENQSQNQSELITQELPQSNETQSVGSTESQSSSLLISSSDLTHRLSLFAALDEGQVIRGSANRSNYDVFNRVWQQSMFFHLTNELSYKERMKLILSFESRLVFSYKQDNRYPATLQGVFDFYPNDIELNYIFGTQYEPWLKLGIGYFPYKYNPDTKHLGEYLLRCTAYPTIIYSWWEFPMVRELGLYAKTNFNILNIDRLNLDFLFTSETRGWPLQDWTFTAVLGNNLLNFFDFGAGVSFQRFLSVNELKTTPKVNSNMYLDENGDTNYYTFKSTKLVGRASLNPLRFIPNFTLPLPQFFGNTPFFGNQDLKIYGEAAVLGIENKVAYMWSTDVNGNPVLVKAPKVGNPPVNYYDSLGDRMPYMVGINLPTQPLISYGVLPLLLTKWLKDETGDDIRLLSYITLIPALTSGLLNHFWGLDLRLDVMALEFEWVSQRYPNDDYPVLDFTSGNRPLPASNQTRLNTIVAKAGYPQKVKYAFYFKKSFFNQRFALSGLIARDHMRPPYNGEYIDAVTDDFVQTKNQWWWTLRLSANF